MAYNFSIAGISRRIVGGVITGAIIAVRCENADNGAVLGATESSWFAPKADFPAWPPSKVQVRAYIVSYLRAKAQGSPITRAAQMKQKTALIQDDPETWSAAERIISTQARYDR